MKKQIIIELTEEGQRMITEGFTPFEVLGLLRFYEKFCWLNMATQIEAQIKEQKNKES